MLETFTPAVCGSRKRQRAASLIFAVSATAVAFALGALLGLAGATIEAHRAVLGAAALALLAAAREAGLVRLPLPQMRRQVPEGWRFRMPLPVWASGYGAGLGAGVFTYQPVSTFWVACAGALALARPLPAALCFALYGAGRAAMVVWPRRRPHDSTEAVERLSRRSAAVLRLNAAALAVCAGLLAAAPAAPGAVYAPGLDPSADAGVVAWARQDGSVVVRSAGTNYTFPEASAPAVDGNLLAYVDDEGIRIVRWRTGQEVLRITGNATAVALDWPLLAYRREDSTRRRLVLRNLDTDSVSVVSAVIRTTDLGRPSISGRRLVWHVATKSGSRLRLLNVASGRRFTLASSKIVLVRNPSIEGTRVVWAVERSGYAAIRMRSIWGSASSRVARVRSRDLGFWSTALSANRVYATRWSLRTRAATIYSFAY
jgi:cytochrome c biogenesis protein CcdA